MDKRECYCCEKTFNYNTEGGFLYNVKGTKVHACGECRRKIIKHYKTSDGTMTLAKVAEAIKKAQVIIQKSTARYEAKTQFYSDEEPERKPNFASGTIVSESVMYDIEGGGTIDLGTEENAMGFLYQLMDIALTVRDFEWAKLIQEDMNLLQEMMNQ